MLQWLEQKVVHLAGPITYVLGLRVFTKGPSYLFVPFYHFCSSYGASLFHNVVLDVCTASLENGLSGL